MIMMTMSMMMMQADPSVKARTKEEVKEAALRAFHFMPTLFFVFQVESAF